MSAVALIRERPHQPVETEKADDLHPSFLLRLLDEIDYGLVVVSTQGRVQHANHLARQEMAAARVLEGAVGQALVACNASAARQLMAAIQGALQGRRSLLCLSHDGHELPIAVIPLAHALEGPASVLLVMARQRASDNLVLQMFAREHHLTPTEESVLRALCDGRDVEEIAMHRGVAESTVRTQVRSLRDKTGAAGMRQLVQRVMALPPVVPALRSRVTPTRQARPVFELM